MIKWFSLRLNNISKAWQESFNSSGLYGPRIDKSFLWAAKMFITKAVVIIMCDRLLFLINKMLSFQRYV